MAGGDSSDMTSRVYEASKGAFSYKSHNLSYGNII